MCMFCVRMYSTFVLVENDVFTDCSHGLQRRK